MKTEQNGWGKPTPTARRFHYFDGFRSLCGGYGWLGPRDELEEGCDVHPENCASCQRKRAQQKERAAKAEGGQA